MQCINLFTLILSCFTGADSRFSLACAQGEEVFYIVFSSSLRFDYLER